MKTELKEFLAEGLKHYKHASYVMTVFFKNTQGELQEILRKRKDWGSVFEPKEAAKVKSTRYWVEYPLINAIRDGTIDGKAARIGIAINWYESESEYPFYRVWLKEGPEETYLKIGAYKDKGPFELMNGGRGLRFNPNPEDFDLDRDFNLMIDEFVKIL